MGFIMRIIRWPIGALLIFFDWLFTPKGISRAPEAQAAIDEQTKNLTLYHFKACPFCIKVRREMKRHSLTVEKKDAKRCELARQELLAGGGKSKVPCLKIQDASGNATWMYESSEIIRHLQEQFATK